ncbi:superoxide dismutase [Mn]-like [Haliotis asinina]|uniref:superoxide dismutase [Mn]-like n=1 Tax=Haliotis asinina TaxID=109174 RepID=UPI003531BBE6
MASAMSRNVLCWFVFCFSVVISMPYNGMEIYSDDYKLPDLPYPYNSLEPIIDEATVRVHHTGHHAAYTKKMNAALRQWRVDPDTDNAGLSSKSILDILTKINEVPEMYRNAIRNNGGGFVNHNLYWSVMAPSPDGEEHLPESDLLNDIQADFGNYTAFKQLFTREAAKLFGSGYVWLSRQPRDGSLLVSTTANQDSPLSQGLLPILVLDVWEHAYYLKYQNRRPDHVSNWWRLVDWGVVAEIDIWWQKTVHDEL